MPVDNSALDEARLLDLFRMEEIGFTLARHGIISRLDVRDDAYDLFLQGKDDAGRGIPAHSNLGDYSGNKTAKAYFSACYMTGYLHGTAERVGKMPETGFFTEVDIQRVKRLTDGGN